MSIHDDMFKIHNLNPDNPYDPSPGRLNRLSSGDDIPSGTLKGWKRIAVIGSLLVWFILVGTWTPS
jgi:hypothetical protein